MSVVGSELNRVVGMCVGVAPCLQRNILIHVKWWGINTMMKTFYNCQISQIMIYILDVLMFDEPC